MKSTILLLLTTLFAIAQCGLFSREKTTKEHGWSDKNEHNSYSANCPDGICPSRTYDESRMNNFIPYIDLWETADAYYLIAEAAGLTASEMSVEVKFKNVISCFLF